jgi:peptidoglycan/LPS O-acetylase OafA/YrhL
MIETERKPTKRIFGLDLLRVLSIMLVLCSHTSWIYPPSTGWFAKIIDMCGFYGVELFFVLSGFLIGSSLFKKFTSSDFGFQSMWLFLKRRLLRIVPNYYLIIIINIFIGLYIGYSIKEAWKYFLFYQNFSTPLLPFFPESWSMPIKELGYFFLVINLLVFSFLFKKKSRNKLFLTVVIGMLIIGIGTKIHYYFNTENTNMAQWDLSLRSVVIYRIDSVLFGVLFGYINCVFPKFWNQSKYNFAILGISITLAILVCLVLFDMKIKNFPFFWNVAYLPINSFALACLLPVFSQWEEVKLVISKPITLISEISYSIYLIHYSIILFLMHHYIDSSKFSMLQYHLYTFAYFSVTFILSYFLYTYFEKPITKRSVPKVNSNQ